MKGSGGHSHTFSVKYNAGDGSWYAEIDAGHNGGGNWGKMATNTTGNHTHELHNQNANHNHNFATGNESNSHSHALTINNKGGGSAFDNRPAYYVVAFIMKL